MQWTETFGYLGALMTLMTFSMKTMLHLRMVGIVSNLAFITYGVLGYVYPVLLLHLALLPLNVWRLRQLLQLTRQIKEISGSRLSMEWLKPFSHRKAVQAGDTLFRQGDAAAEVLFVLSGRFRAVEAGVAVEQGEVIGELGLITRGHKRTQTVVCEQAGSLLLVSYDEIRQMYYQNPRFGFFFLELVAERLMRDAGRTTPDARHSG
ncbi:cyclic nucleotide-binding domain-containing protein [Variovorax paradoxus]|nr:cyclic nucleotide-binding domain-containing protein [Variovorax paradoxus]